MNPPSDMPMLSLSGHPTQNESLGELGDGHSAHWDVVHTFPWDTLSIFLQYHQQALASIAAT